MWNYWFGQNYPNNIMYEFKVENSFIKRKNESTKIKEKYVNIIPTIIEYSGPISITKLGKVKFLVNKDMTIGQLLYNIRKQINLNPTQALFLFVNNNMIPCGSRKLGELYREYADDDGFLYITYSMGNTFG